MLPRSTRAPRPMCRSLLIGVALGLLCAMTGTASGAPAYAPVDHPGPVLPISPALLAGSVQCHGNLQDTSHEPVLLFPATTVTSTEDFGYNLEKSLTYAGFAWCTSDQPGSLSTNMGDIQTRAYYATYAIRHVYALAGQKIAVMGHSQGGMIMRESLRFWPDTRAMVGDVIGIAGSNHGSDTISAQCEAGCSAAFRQQAAGAQFEAALNSYQETFAGIDYTEISSNLDEVVTPGGVYGASSVHGPGDITDVAIQDVCPTSVSADTTEHLQLAGDPVTWALADDALTHPGPADPARISSSVCSQVFPPGTDPATFDADQAASATDLADTTATYPDAATEPALDCWAYADCTGALAPTLVVINHHTMSDHRRDAKVNFVVTTLEGTAYVPVSGVAVTVDGQTVTTDANGAASTTLHGALKPHLLVTASLAGCNPGTEKLRFT